MPRSSVALTAEPLSGDAVVAAAGRVWTAKAGPGAEPLEARVLDEGAVLQIVAGGEVVLSVLRPRLLPRLDEVERLLPGTKAPEGTQWWTDAYTPWRPEGAVGVAVLDAAAEASRGIAVHQGLAPTRNAR
ncbi:hypothetical protein [Microbacterium sp. BK668]|uniref:hypothetical protein n=1 Tax=Microbacterium sp. BK668 TaxID=2512118 RepID=UPI00105D1508|nr:hypothetical protein [Microbacterium sp. BK668]TDN91321.1 hypothetical protein EV279_0820 [Microbacterium sp. BK668]